MRKETSESKLERKRHNKLIGQRLKKLRECHGLKQSELGTLISVSGSQIQKYENGIDAISTFILYRLSDSLSVPVLDFLVDDKGELIATIEQRLIYQFNALNTLKLQNGFIDLMKCVNEAQGDISLGGAS